MKRQLALAWAGIKAGADADFSREARGLKRVGKLKAGFLVFVLTLGFLLFPSVNFSGSTATAIRATRNGPAQQSEVGPLAPAAIFTVNSILDTPDANPGNGVCNDAGGNCTLRAAIMESNASPGPDTIGFDIAPAGPKTIALVNALPPITEMLTINGTTQPGFAGMPIIELDATAALGPSLLVVQASNSTLRGLVVNRKDGNAIALVGSNNRVLGNFIGTDLSGTAAGPGNSGAGVLVLGGGSMIGGIAAGDPNIIAFNGTGVSVQSGLGSPILSNSITRNTILGIDLNADGVTTPDACDPDTGANDLQNFPVLSGAQINTATGNLSVQGTLNSKAGSSYRIEFFSNAVCHPSGFGEGQRLVGSTTVITNAACDANFNLNFTVVTPVGESLSATATDAANNTSEFCQCVPILVTDCTITCPANITESNDPNLCGATVNYPAPMTSGTCGAVTCDPPAGSFFPVGTTTVTCTTAVGPACSFTTTVNDTQAPLITCPADLTQSTSPNQCSAVVTYPPPTANDNCPGVNVACNPLSGSSFPKGTTTVTCTATDTSGNSANCSFMVIVNDNQNPTITCPGNVTAITADPGGATVNYPPPSASDNCPGVTSSCNPPFGSNFPVGMTVVTCMATDASGNSAVCAFTVTVNLVSCTITCSPNLVRTTDPNRCRAVVDYPPPDTGGTCGAVNCVPPSGSVFELGTTTVSCTTGAGPSCSFNVTVIDNQPPTVTCPGGIIATLPSGQVSAIVNYPDATATDNCSVASVGCSPPSGTRFPVGVTFVTCGATDLSVNSASCVFSVTVVDTESPVIRCPANIGVVPPAGQTSAVVTYPAPTVSDNLPGVGVVCAPPSGSSFPVGVTTVTCTATDVSGNKSSCSFTVSVGGPQARVIIPGGKASVEFGNPIPVNPQRKPKKAKKNPCQFFAVQNIGFAPLVLTLDSIARTGSEVGNRIADPNDLRYFTLSLVNADQSLTPLDIGGMTTVQPGAAQNFCLRFNALIPATTGKDTGYRGDDVLSANMTSRVTFRQNAGAPISVPVLSHVATFVNLIDPANPRRPPVVTLARSGDFYTVLFSVFDANLDVNRAKYEFFDSAGQQIGQSIEVDLGEVLRQLNPLPGVSLNFEQRFSGANSNPDAKSVVVMVFDGESSDSSTSASVTGSASIQLLSPAQDGTVYLPDMKLRPLLPSQRLTTGPRRTGRKIGGSE